MTSPPATSTGFGAELFLPSQLSSVPVVTHTREDSESDVSDEDDDQSIDQVAESLAKASLGDKSEWQNTPYYTATYLSTISEPLPPPLANSKSQSKLEDEVLGLEAAPGGWTMESYENSLTVDTVFEKFTKRVSLDSEQCIRYDLGGAPLPFQSDQVFKDTFQTPKATGAASSITTARQYDLSSTAVPRCPFCGGERVFECQLMPNLLNVLKSSDQDVKKGQTDAERRAELQRLVSGLKGGGVKPEERTGMEWGVCMIFSCKADCTGTAEGEDKTCWREEIVLIQWDE